MAHQSCQDVGKEGWCSRTARSFLRCLVQGYFSIEVDGAERIPKESGVIIASNHPSVLDGLLLLALSPRPVRFLVAEDFYNHPLLNPLFKSFGCIEVYRTKTHNGDALRAAIAALKQGAVVGIFPEGTTHFGGTLPTIKQGVALLALRTGAPVICLTIHGSMAAFSPHAKFPHPVPIRLSFGAPLSYPRTTRDQIPDAQVIGARETIRKRLLALKSAVVLGVTSASSASPFRQIGRALAAVVIVPLGWVLTLTAPQSLDPLAKA